MKSILLEIGKLNSLENNSDNILTPVFIKENMFGAKHKLISLLQSVFFLVNPAATLEVQKISYQRLMLTGNVRLQNVISYASGFHKLSLAVYPLTISADQPVPLKFVWTKSLKKITNKYL